MSSQPTFTHIALMGRQRADGIEETLLALYRHLTARGYHVVFEQETAAAVVSQPCAGVPAASLSEHAQLLVVVGGDGSLLHAAKIAVEQGLPVLGINRGRLGFLTDIYPHEYSKIEAVLTGAYQEEARFLLSAQLQTAPHAKSLVALNEIVISPGNIGHMIEFEVSIGDEFVCGQRADGLILATPTGSTAYALSAGGPIVHPSLDALVLAPMFPHTLSNRPLVVPADRMIAIKIAATNIAIPFVSSDGQQQFSIPPGDTLLVKKHAQPLRLIHPLDYTYYTGLRAKLGWQSKHPVHKNPC